MFGLAVFAVMAGYLLLSIGIVVWAVRVARRKGRSALRWGGGAALVMYLIPFWDWIPTVAMHRYYCGKEAGFWVYKTVEQWKAENPGVMETLVYDRAMNKAYTADGSAWLLNSRFTYVYKSDGPLFPNRWRLETEIRDNVTGRVVAREVGFSTSQERRQAGWAGWKLWLIHDRCTIESHRDAGSFDKIITQFEGAKK